MRRLEALAIVLTATAGAAGAQPLVVYPTSPDLSADAALVNREVFRPGAGPVRYQSGEFRLSPGKARAVDSVRLTVAGALRTPAGLPITPDRAEYDARAYEVSVIRNWPSALSFDAGAVGVEVSPHAGLGLSNTGAGSAEAGAMVSVGKSRDDKAVAKLKDMGVQDGAMFGGQGRWYVYAAASGRAVGLNMLHGDQGWNRAGWTTDPTSALIGDAQLGVGFRKGALQTSLGYIHREVKGQHMIWGQQTRDDSLVAFSLTLRPSR